MHLENPSPIANSKGPVNQILKVILGLNLLVLFVKLFIGIKASSLSIIGDAVHSGVDSLNNIIGLVMISIAAHPPDEDHPYGHDKFETLGALAVVAFLAIACFELVEKSIMRFLNPGDLPHIESSTIILLAVTLVINIFVWAYEKKAGEKYNSELLLADAEHTFSDVLITASILVSTYFILQGFYILDPLLGILVAAVIMRSGIQILKRTIPILVDEAWLVPDDIAPFIAEIPKAKYFHGMKSRRSNERNFLEVKVQFDTDSLAEAHELSHQLEEKIIEKHGQAQITIHIEPVA